MIKLKNFLSFVLLNFLILFTITSFAYPFIIAPTTGTTLPTSLIPGTTAPAYYTVTNNTLETRVDNHVKYLPPNVTQMIAGGTCGRTFTLAPFGSPGSSCTLQLLVSGPVDGNDPDQTHHLFVCFPGDQVCAGTQYSLNVNVTQKIAAIDVTPHDATIADNGTQQYTATGTFPDGSKSDITNEVLWTSTNPTAATISQSGLASGVTRGQDTSIQAAMASVKSNLAILHVQKHLVSIAVTPSTQQMRVGSSYQFTAIGTYDDATTADLTSTVTWQSSSPSIVSISANTGLATAVASGTANIFATQNNITSNSAAANVASLVSIAVTPTTQQMRVGFNYQFTATGTFNDSSTADITSTVTWQSSNPSLVSIGANTGQATGVALGTANISATQNSITSNSAAATVVRFAYLSESQSPNGISYCQISSTGTLSGCVVAGSGARDGVAVNIAGTFLIAVTSNPSSMVHCPIAIDGSINTCTTSTVATGASGNSEGVAINPVRNMVYVTGLSSGAIYYCNINSSGDTTACQSYAVSGPSYPAVSPNGKFLYTISSTSTNIYYCTLDPATGNVTNCTPTQVLSLSQSIEGLAVDPTGQYLYVFYSLSGVNCFIRGCNIDQTTGNPTCVTNVNVPCSQPKNLAADPNGAYLYTANNSFTNNFQTCAVSGTNIGSCSTTTADNPYSQIGIR